MGGINPPHSKCTEKGVHWAYYTKKMFGGNEYFLKANSLIEDAVIAEQSRNIILAEESLEKAILYCGNSVSEIEETINTLKEIERIYSEEKGSALKDAYTSHYLATDFQSLLDNLVTDSVLPLHGEEELEQWNEIVDAKCKGDDTHAIRILSGHLQSCLDLTNKLQSAYDVLKEKAPQEIIQETIWASNDLPIFEYTNKLLNDWSSVWLTQRQIVAIELDAYHQQPEIPKLQNEKFEKLRLDDNRVVM